eukprot:TRINITY_DN1179_c0_g1_i1.p1 TRINITY_DN1179_c0_g1~~TRINITY_DN1179_c0_g1_i1.p1  ORF type:complete len:207 (-),score=80.41 TRINITY_DN1179_c0_g1_i1:82-702(-)
MSGRKKPLSLEEKRTRLRDLLLETKQVYTLKELVSLASKEKGIVANTVEDVLKSLVDDGLVQTDKIGTSNYFWAFPSQDLQKKKNKTDALQKDRTALQERLDHLTTDNATLKVGREPSAERQALLEELKSLEANIADIKQKIGQYAENDPELLTAMKRDTQTALEAANRWTDNIFSIQKYCDTKFNMQQSDFNKQFEVPEDLDYVT